MIILKNFSKVSFQLIIPLNINKQIFTKENFVNIILRDFPEKIDHLIHRKEFIEILTISFPNLISQDI